MTREVRATWEPSAMGGAVGLHLPGLQVQWLSPDEANSLAAQLKIACVEQQRQDKRKAATHD